MRHTSSRSPSERRFVVVTKTPSERADGLVSTRRDGKAVYYNLASAEARVVIGAIYDVFCKKTRKR